VVKVKPLGRTNRALRFQRRKQYHPKGENPGRKGVERGKKTLQPKRGAEARNKNWNAVTAGTP